MDACTSAIVTLDLVGSGNVKHLMHTDPAHTIKHQLVIENSPYNMCECFKMPAFPMLWALSTFYQKVTNVVSNVERI